MNNLMTIFKKPATMIITGIVGIIVTNIFTAKATIKYVEKKQELGHVPTKEEATKLMVSCYGPAIATGIVTIGAILNGNKQYLNIQNNLIDGANINIEKYKNFYNAAVKTVGLDKINEIRNESVPSITKNKLEPISQGSILVYDPFSKESNPRFIETTMEEYIEAKYRLNEQVSKKQKVNINYWYQLLSADTTMYGETFGYNVSYLYDQLGEVAWIDIDEELFLKNDYQYYYPIFKVPPIAGYEHF